ncbi:hypothetical protein PRZ48_007193 [Zasmidium cellare]|uniref:Uncharacterized protein n=1 Tax=Zasmidium cellare TaxID=395010 RepID=A0ABR0EIP8_ZASCE|nr:hypothetical protein PRZ48_007193 [Zasmidium cellare]
MAQPVLVKAYTDSRPSTAAGSINTGRAQALPAISSFAFADILRAADCPDFQVAIDGIAEIAAKNRMSLADEYASHLPPLGEITAAGSSGVRPHLYRPSGGMRRALTSVPEASSSSSESSRKSKKRGSIFSFRKQTVQESKPMRRMRIGSMGRTVPVGTTTALAAEAWSHPGHTRTSSDTTITAVPSRPTTQARSSSAAETSLQRLLASRQAQPDG